MNGIKKMSSGRLASKERKKLDTSEFGIPELREFKAQLARNILAKAHLLGVNIKSPVILEWAEK